MSLTPVLVLGLPLLTATLFLALYPWRHRATAFGLPGAVLALCLVLSTNFDDAALWVALLGLPTLASIMGLTRAWWRFSRSSR